MAIYLPAPTNMTAIYCGDDDTIIRSRIALFCVEDGHIVPFTTQDANVVADRYAIAYPDGRVWSEEGRWFASEAALVAHWRGDASEDDVDGDQEFEDADLDADQRSHEQQRAHNEDTLHFSTPVVNLRGPERRDDDEHDDDGSDADGEWAQEQRCAGQAAKGNGTGGASGPPKGSAGYR